MKRDDETKRRVEALLLILEGEVKLLKDEIFNAMHWNDGVLAETALNHIKKKVDQIFNELKN